MEGYIVYTTWYFDQHGIGRKEYNYTQMTQAELRTRIEQDGRTDVTVWIGNWFGLAPDNLPQPDYDYNIVVQ